MTSAIVRQPEWAERALARPSDSPLLPERREPEPLPVLPALHGLVASLRRGQVVAVPPPLGGGGGSLLWALVAAASAEGRWAAAVGLPDSGVLAAAELGVDLDRLVLVDEPGERWPDVAGALLGAVDIVVLRPDRRPSGPLARRLAGVARQHGTVLLVAGDWEGAQLRLQVVSSRWSGLGAGHGHLQGRQVLVEASGRGADGRARSSWLWLPRRDGTVAIADPPADLEVRHTIPAAAAHLTSRSAIA